MPQQPPHLPPSPSARELEREAAGAPAPAAAPAPPSGEVMAMLQRRGFQPSAGPCDLPFPPTLAEREAEALAGHLGHYAFRLFLRGAILRHGPFLPEETTRYLEPVQARRCAEALVSLGLARHEPSGRYQLLQPAASFGGTLEWYVARELRRRGFEAQAGLRFHAPGIGGDLDVVAAAEGKLLYLELKSSPPKHLTAGELCAFLGRVRALRPHVSLFVMDTALRLTDKVLPMLEAALREGRGAASAPRRVVREVWALTPHLYALNAREDLMDNISAAIAEGLQALSPPAP